MIKSSWLLVLCALLEAAYAALNFFMRQSDGSLALRTFIHRSTGVEMGVLALAAGVATIAASFANFRNGRGWLLALNGLACATLGALLAFWTGPLAFRAIALLIVVMAISAGIYELAAARSFRLFGVAGAVSLGFALAFAAFIFHWIKLNPESPMQTLFWLGAYFAFSALCMLGLGLRAKTESH